MSTDVTRLVLTKFMSRYIELFRAETSFEPLPDERVAQLKQIIEECAREAAEEVAQRDAR